MQRQFLKFTLFFHLYACIQGNLFAYTAYFSNVDDGNVKVVDTTNNTIFATISGLRGARDLAITPDGRYLYVSQAYGNISIIDTTANSVVDTISISSPRQIAVSPDGESLYVTQFSGNNVKIYSTATNTLSSSSIYIGEHTSLIAINPAGDLAYIVTELDRIKVVNLQDNSTEATITGLSYIGGIIFSSDGTKVYVANSATDQIFVYDALTHTQLAVIPTGEKPQGLSTTPDGEFLYVCNSDNSVNVISTSLNAVVATIGVGTNPHSTAITPDGNTVYTANSDSGNSSVINASTNTVSSVLTLSARLYDVLIAPFAAPASLSGSQKINDFGVRYELYNTLNWTPSITPATIGYNIYRNGTLIGSTAGINATTYVDHNQEEGVSYQYSVRSRTSNGDLSYPATVTVN